MIAFRFKTEDTIMRLLWIMVAVIIFSAILTIAGQPDAFWQNPAMALRADGLSVNNATNRTFEFFLANGLFPFLLANVVYIITLFVVTNALPRRIALVLIFSVIFGHFYGTCNWLAVRWHFGLQGSLYYGLVLGLVMVFVAFRKQTSFDPLNTLRRIMLLAMFADMLVTIIGQPTGYFHNPQLVHEGNAASRFFLQQGWFAFVLEQAAIAGFIYWLAGVLPKPWGNVLAWVYIFAGFSGASNWLYFEWRLGMQAVLAFGGLLSLIITITAFAAGKKAFASITLRDTGVQQKRLCNVC